MATTPVNVSALRERLAATDAWQSSMETNLNQFFLVIMGMCIFLMQAGFAFLEAGAVRSKNTTNILIKNALDSFFAGVSYWLVGYAFAFGDGNSFIGYTYFAHDQLPDTLYAHWFFQYVFAATAATIVSGAVAERCDFLAYVIYSIAITGFIYPVVTHWAWTSDGWLAAGKAYDIDGTMVDIGYSDFAGSGVVHLLGGVSAFVAALALGPRIGRFDKETGKAVDIKGHSVPLASLGGFILVFGFFAFNGSSQGSISAPGDGAAVSMAVKNTVISGSAGAFTTLLLNKVSWIGDSKWSYLTTLNGCLTGMVAICAGCNQFTSYMSFIIGIGGGICYMITTWLVLKLKVDDPLDACAVHFGGGVWGALCVPLFSFDFGVFYFWDKKSGIHLAWQLAGMSAIFLWTSLLCCVVFFGLKFARILRVPFEYELKGLDIIKHGEAAYPTEAYGHGWGEKGDTLSGLMRHSVKSARVPGIVPTDLKIDLEPAHRPSEHAEVDALNAKKQHKNGNMTQSSESVATTDTSMTQL